MSHLVTVETKIHDPHAVAAACQRLELPGPLQGTAQLYSGEAAGLLIRLPGWKYPAVVDTLTGTIRYDNFQGHWGEIAHLHRFLQMYAVEKAKLEARRRGHAVQETALENGSIKLRILEGV